MCAVVKNDFIEGLISKLLWVPFPYNEILIQQIRASKMSCIEAQGYYCISFDVEPNIPKLPFWLDKMPLSWQVLIDNTPTLFYVFINNDHIEKIEVIDMGFETINWKRLFEAPVLLDQEYDEQYILGHLTTGKLCIEKTLVQDHSIDWMIKTDGNGVLACFRDCRIWNLQISDSTVKSLSIIKENQNDGAQYTVRSDDGKINFDCSLIFLRWNTIIG